MVIEKDATRQNSENTTSDSGAYNTFHLRGFFVLLGARTILIRGTSGYVLRLGSLVNARRSLYQSKPSIEATKANTAQGGCHPRRIALIGAVYGASGTPTIDARDEASRLRLRGDHGDGR
jgi:hypothetical protein